MCETSATPLHSDGLLGDAINFLLSGSYEATTSHDREYSEAQAQGQVSSGDGDMSDNKISITSHLSIAALWRLFSLSQYLSCVSLQIFLEILEPIYIQNKHKMLLYVVLIVISFQYVNISQV